MVLRVNTGVMFDPEISQDIWKDVIEGSFVGTYGTQVAMPGAGMEFQVLEGGVTAAWVDEGGRKGVSSPTFSKRTFRPRKVVAAVPFSDEFKRDKAALYAAIKPQLTEALIRKIDNAVLHNIDTPSDFSHLGTATKVVLDPALALASLGNALNAIVANDGTMDTIALSPLAAAKLLTTVATDGRPLFTNTASGSLSPVLGASFVVAKAAGSKSTTAADTLGIAGPLSELKWGFVEGIKYEEYGGPIYSGSTLVHAGRQDNMSTLIVEVEVGSMIRTPLHFARLVEGTGTTPETPDTP